jgi:hypothetical protein
MDKKGVGKGGGQLKGAKAHKRRPPQGFSQSKRARSKAKANKSRSTALPYSTPSILSSTFM